MWGDLRFRVSLLLSLLVHLSLLLLFPSLQGNIPVRRWSIIEVERINPSKSLAKERKVSLVLPPPRYNLPLKSPKVQREKALSSNPVFISPSADSQRLVTQLKERREGIAPVSPKEGTLQKEAVDNPTGKGATKEGEISNSNSGSTILSGEEINQELGFLTIGTKEVDLDGESKRKLGREIRAKIERVLKYPHRAEKRKLGGRVRVGFYLLPDGKIRELTIVQSSGSEILDGAVIAAVKKAAPFPNDFHLGEVWITVPISFKYR